MDDELFDELRAPGMVDSEGAFSIDLAAAGRKMAAWRFADPTSWALGGVMLAVACGASHLVMRLDFHGRCRFEFDGRPVPVAWLQGLIQGERAAFESHEAFRALALTFELARAAGARGLTVASHVDGGFSTSLLDRLRGTPTRLEMIAPASRDPLLARAFHERCRWAPVDVVSYEGPVVTLLSAPISLIAAVAVIHVVTVSQRPGARLWLQLGGLGERLVVVEAEGDYEAVVWLDTRPPGPRWSSTACRSKCRRSAWGFPTCTVWRRSPICCPICRW